MHKQLGHTPTCVSKSYLLSYVLIFICACPYGFVVNRVLIPHAIVGGGLTGLCEILYFLTSGEIPIWISQLGVNLLFLTVACFTVGWRFCLKTVYCVGCLTVWLHIFSVPAVPPIPDTFIAILIGAVLNGVGMGVIFLCGGSTGGMDIVAMVLHKYRSWQLGRILMAFDFIIISSAYFLPEVHSLQKILFVLAYDFVATNVIDCTLLAKHITHTHT